MKKTHRRHFLIIGGLILVTAMAMAYTGAAPRFSNRPVVGSGNIPLPVNGAVSVSGNLVQEKILYGSDGQVTLALTLAASEKMPEGRSIGNRNVDMVIVMDRSGSMAGEKIESAGAAVRHLIHSLTPEDRFALVAYSDNVRRYCDLTPVSGENFNIIESAVAGIIAGGSTNLGAGMAEGLELLRAKTGPDRLKKMVLISDGLANKGITDPDRLGNMASMAPENRISLTTVGVGLDFNEYLMTRIADQGTGDFYFLQNPQAFAEVFLNEYRNIRSAAATSLAVRIPLHNGVELVDAGGYPINMEDGTAVFHPGDLRIGQTRKLFLTFRIPTDRLDSYRIDGIHVQYRAGSELQTVRMRSSFDVACVKDREDVWASIKKSEWTQKVLQEDYNRLKEEVASHIKAGRKAEALERINAYRMQQSAVNAVVASSEVQENLEQDLGTLNDMVNHTFEGETDKVMIKQKQNSKSLQYESYQGRRAKKQ